MPRYVAVVGPGSEALGAEPTQDRILTAAYDVGRLLADADAVVLCGGGSGVMGAVAEGVAAAGGTSIGLLPGSDRADGHPALSFALPTGLGELRNGLLVRAADRLIAVGCSWGTLSEIALAVRTGVPVAALDCWDLPDEVRRCGTPDEAVALASE